MKLISWKIEAPRLCTHARAMLRLWEKWFDRICMGEKIARHILSTRCNWFLILLLQPTTSRRWYCLTSSWLEDCLFLLIVMAQLAADVFVLAHSVLEDRVYLFSYRWKGSWGRWCWATLFIYYLLISGASQRDVQLSDTSGEKQADVVSGILCWINVFFTLSGYDPYTFYSLSCEQWIIRLLVVKQGWSQNNEAVRSILVSFSKLFWLLIHPFIVFGSLTSIALCHFWPQQATVSN